MVDHATAEHATDTSDGAPADDRAVFTILDRSFGKAVFLGYGGGILLIFAFMMGALSRYMSGAALIASGAAVAFFIGIMGGAVAVGVWSTKHEEEIFH